MLPERFRAQHNIYLNGWMRAEEVLKITERIKNETFIPSVKELRYASRRIVQAHLDLENGKATDDEILVHLTEAIENCRKARHDAIDSAINYVHEQLDKLADQVGLAVLSQAFPRYTELRGKIKLIDERIVASRKDRCALDDEYEAIKREHLGRVVDLYYELECSEATIREIQKRERNQFLTGVVGVGIVLAVFITSGIVIADKRGAFDWAIPVKAHEAKATADVEKPKTTPKDNPEK